LVDGTSQERPALVQEGLSPRPSPAGQVVRYDRRQLTYANSFDSFWKANTIRAIEWLTGKITIIRMLREFQRLGPHDRRTYWRDALDVMRIDIQTPHEQLTRIPAKGPVVIVANHPHGLVDGMIISDLISRTRIDYKVLTRSILTSIDEIAASFMIPVPFPHDDEAQKKGIEMRAAAMEQLSYGGVVALFPSGVVASSETMFGPVVEAEWNVFTAKMIRRSGASIVPIYFPGSNSRWYQVANRVSATLRQGLLLHEIVAACRKPQKPVIGHPINPEEVEKRIRDPRAFVAWLRSRTLALRETG